MEIIVFWLLLAAGVGLLANSQGRSGLGFFLLSAVLSPLLGLIVVLVTKNPKEQEEKERLSRQEHERQLESIKAIAATSAPSAPHANTSSMSVASAADEIMKLGELRDRGLLTDAEFQSQKVAILRPSVSALIATPQPSAVPPARPCMAEMEEFGITFDGERYQYQEFRYEKLDDALRYAKLQAKR
jgi:hypothetical protein